VGYRGPAPKPTALERAEGNPSKRALNTDEPAFRRITPTMPAWVKADPFASRMWRKMAPMMKRGGVLTEADQLGLANICMDAALIENSWAQIKQTGLLVKQTESKMIRANPLLQVVQQTQDRLTRSLREYGLTASARSRIHVGTEIAAGHHQESLEQKLRKPGHLIPWEQVDAKPN
jgi:P27 family predicted phage terminase small subunit